MTDLTEPIWAILLQKLLVLISVFCDVVTFIPWKIIMIGSRYTKSQAFQKSSPVTGKLSDPWQARINNRKHLLETGFGEAKTMKEAFDRACSLNPNSPSLGTRELLSESDEIQPNGRVFKKAIYGKYQWIPFKQLRQEVYNLASGLSELGVKRVCIYMETRAEWMMVAHACFQHNIEVATVYSTLGEQSVVDALQEAEIEHIITSASLMDTKMAGISAAIPELKLAVYAPFENRSVKLNVAKFPKHLKCVSFSELTDIGKSSTIKTNPNAPITKDTVAIIMYTSGTTGKPKGVLLTHGNIVSCASAMYARISDFENPFSNDHDSWLAYLPLAHILELAAENCVLLNGIKVGYGSTLTISDKSSRIKKGSKGDASELRPTVMAAVPEISERIRKAVMASVSEMNPFRRVLFNFAYKYKLSHKKRNMPTPLLDKYLFSKTKMLLGGRLRVFISGGAPLDVKTQRFINICMCTDVSAGYGLTETTAGATLQDMFDNRAGNVGVVLDSTYVKLVDWKEGNYSINDKPFPRGEVHVGGNTVGQGYYKMPEKTAEDFYDENGVRWFKTGDIGLLDNTGNLTLIDRKKDLVKLRHGEYVALGKIEACLKTSPLCDNVAVFADQTRLSCVAVAVANQAQITKLAAQNQISGSFEDVCKNSDIVSAVYGSFLEAAKTGKLHKQEIPTKLHLETTQWTPDTGMVTDALKLKRKSLNQRYDSIVRKLYE